MLLTGAAVLAGCSHGKGPVYAGGSTPTGSPPTWEGAPRFEGRASPDPAPSTADKSASHAEEPASAAPARDPFESERAERRPGLATEWGEALSSRVTRASFTRGEPNAPFAAGKLFYNDAQGIAAMAGGSRVARTLFAIGGPFVSLGLKDGRGRFITGFSAADGNNYLAGVSGDRYRVVVKNNSPGRVEVVVSVDGLDVIDGRDASPDKRGYLLDPFGEVEIDGFRTSTSEVAAFRFGSVDSSYAALKHGDTRNVGVIGVAAFSEEGDSPSRWPWPRSVDSDRRLDADPFPGPFAEPPR